MCLRRELFNNFGRNFLSLFGRHLWRARASVENAGESCTREKRRERARRNGGQHLVDEAGFLLAARVVEKCGEHLAEGGGLVGLESGREAFCKCAGGSRFCYLVEMGVHVGSRCRCCAAGGILLQELADLICPRHSWFSFCRLLKLLMPVI